MSRSIGPGVLAVALVAGLALLAVGAVRTVKSDRILSEAWEATEARQWDTVLQLTEPLIGPSRGGRRAAELHCWALVAAGERDRCGEVLDGVLQRGGPMPDAVLVRLAVIHRQRSGRLEAAAQLAREAAAARPRDLLLAGLELSARSAVEHEDTVLAAFEQRLARSEGAAPVLRIALAERYRQRGEWVRAVAALGDLPPDESSGLASRWFEERVAAQAGLGQLAEVQATFRSWRKRGGNPVELDARYAIALSTAQLLDPEANWTELLERAAERIDSLRDPRLRRELHERWIAHLLASGSQGAALGVFERAARLGIALPGITREQIERAGARSRAAEAGGATAATGLQFAIPEGLGRGTLRVSNYGGAEPDAPYERIDVVGAGTVEVERPHSDWPERWVLRDAEGKVRASGSAWAQPAGSPARPIVLNASSVGTTRPSESGPAPARRPADGRTRVFAVVLDCGDWRLVQYLRARGDLPVLEDFFTRGFRAVLRSDPPLTAAAMESLVWPARARAASVLGVVHQLGVELAGLAPVGSNPFGFLAPLLAEGESLFEVVGSGNRVAANMLFAHGGIDAGRHAEMIGPGGLRRSVETARASRPLRPDEHRRFPGFAREPRARGHIEGIAAQLDAAANLARAGEVDLLLLRLESLDLLTHALFSELASSGQDDGVSILLDTYRYIDARLGEIEPSLDADDVLVVLSDHGIRNAMEHEADALFVAVGGGIPSGRTPGRPGLDGVARVLAGLTGVPTAWPDTGIAGWLETAQTGERHARRD